MKEIIKNSLYILIICMVNSLFGQHQKLYQQKEFIRQLDTLSYRILMPKNFDSTKQYPVVLFLHGAGERGSDNKKQLIHGSKLFTNPIHRDTFPAIVIFPQCPKNSYWSNVTINRNSRPIKLKFPSNKKPTKPLALVMKLMDEMATKPYVDNSKIYVGGLSMGGMGTFEIIYWKPTFFAAAFSICGAGNPKTTKKYAKTTPFWVFHGAKDDVVSPQASVAMVNEILRNGGTPNFSLYANDNHNSWDTAFAEPKLLSWLFSNTKTLKK